MTEVHWHIIANLGFKFRSHFTAHWPPCCWRAAGAVLLAGEPSRAMLASARLSCNLILWLHLFYSTSCMRTPSRTLLRAAVATCKDRFFYFVLVTFQLPERLVSSVHWGFWCGHHSSVVLSWQLGTTNRRSCRLQLPTIKTISWTCFERRRHSISSLYRQTGLTGERASGGDAYWLSTSFNLLPTDRPVESVDHRSVWPTAVITSSLTASWPDPPYHHHHPTPPPHQ